MREFVCYMCIFEVVEKKYVFLLQVPQNYNANCCYVNNWGSGVVHCMLTSAVTDGNLRDIDYLMLQGVS